MAYLHGCEQTDALDTLLSGKRVGLITNHSGLIRIFALRRIFLPSVTVFARSMLRSTG